MIFTDELNAISDCIQERMNIFSGNGCIIQKGKEQRIKGITDNIRDYFYIDFEDGDRNIVYVQRDDVGANAHDVTGSFKIVGRAEGVDLQTVIYGIVSCILNNCTASITGSTDDESFIYSDETGQEITCDMSLFRVTFDIEKVMTFDVDCIQLTCKEESC